MSFHPAEFYQHGHGLSLQCVLCPRRCLIRDGERGACLGRRNIAGELVAESYGLSSGFAVDPVEKKPLYHFLPGRDILSFGTAGCNLACQFCQNWSMSHPRDLTGLCVEALPDDIVAKALEISVPAVAFTYNEPIVFAEYVMDTARACQKKGIRTAAVTSGYISHEARPHFFEHIDAANVDLKSFRDDFYRRLCSASLQPVLDTLVYLKNKTKVWLEITNLIIPQENDSSGELQDMSRWIVEELGPDVPLHFSAFHPDYRMRDKSSTTLETLRRARDIARAAGLRYVYTGNVRDEEGASTECPFCGKMLIRRSGFSVVENHLKKGKCGYCAETIAGVFDG